jgi:hypothetical protein
MVVHQIHNLVSPHYKPSKVLFSIAIFGFKLDELLPNEQMFGFKASIDGKISKLFSHGNLSYGERTTK